MGRHARLEAVRMIGRNGVARLHSSTVAVLGVGNVGGQLIQHLGMLGVGLVLIDYDTVEEDNLGTQGFTEDQMGLSKVDARAQTLAKLNPSCRVTVLHRDIESLGLATLRRVDVILCALDSRRIRTVVNEMALRNGTPWIDAAIDGSGQTLTGRVAAYDPRQPGSPCYLCPYDIQSLPHILQEGQRESCTTSLWGSSRQGSVAPTNAFSALGGAVVAVQVVWAMKMLLGRGKEVVGRELYLDLERNTLRTHTQKRNPHCVLDHRILSATPLGDLSMTVGQTFDAAEAKLGEGVQLHLHRRAMVTEVECPTCGAIEYPNKLIETMTIQDGTCECGGGMQAVATGCRDHFSRPETLTFSRKSWKELGLPPDDILTASKGDSELHFLVTGS